MDDLTKAFQNSDRESLNKTIFLKHCNIQGWQTHYLHAGPQGSYVNKASIAGQSREAARAGLARSQLFDLSVNCH